MNILDLIVGKPIATTDERAEQVGPAQGIPIFGLDALSSAAYGPEAALSLLVPLGLMGVRYIIPISAAIITLLVIVYFSYCQTIAAYPSGGGSYTVARFNIGARTGLLAAAALLADYILTAAVGISAGVGALVSAVPQMLPHTLSLCLGILIVITILNLRGVREAGSAFAIPTYLFVGTLLITIAGGILRVVLSGGHPEPVFPIPAPPAVTAVVSYWLLLKVFASGCTALTGVEAVSNGVKAFREPTVKNAQRTLTVIIFLLALLLAGISYLVKAYGITATDPGKPGYQSVLSMLTAAVFGKGFFYYLTMGSILVVLSLSANTAFADFPRLCRAIALNNYLPHTFAYRGRRLVYTYGIVVLAFLCGGVLILFDGVTDRLIPLYAVGAFLAFTLSQSGMVMHWWKKRGAHWLKSAFVNGLGALVTGTTTAVVLLAKFVEGAWITLLFIPSVIALLVSVRRHYHWVKVQTLCKDPVDVRGLAQPPIAVIAIDRWNSVTRQGIEFASRLSPEVIAVHVETDGPSVLLHDEWEHYVGKSFREAGKEPPQLRILPSPYRFIAVPIVQFLLELSKTHPSRHIAVVIPELVEDKWYEYFLHNQRARLLEWVLLARGNEHIFIVNAPWYIRERSNTRKN
ncbi:MAG TPA: APC family permease [Candidatus Acidoferrum sp.]|nr:APC family permease [Candidatus Acidoferrum sp.]